MRHRDRGMTRLSRNGATLVELIVVMAILGTLAGIAVLQVPNAQPPGAHSNVAAEIAALRARAVDTRTPQRGLIRLEGKAYSVTALPDGSVIADSLLKTNRFEGRSGEQKQ